MNCQPFFVCSIHVAHLTKFKVRQNMINEHRKIGKQLQLFNISESASGMVDWYPNGYALYKRIEEYIRGMLAKYDYREVKSPVLASHDLWKNSGHSDKYNENMFHLTENNLSVKPMSCPFHINIFDDIVQSYKELPFRIAEFGLCHRNEPSGALNGLFRLRAFNQDDGHIFCREEQIKNELKHFCQLLFEMYQFFGFEKDQIKVKISLRPDNKLGSEELWDRSESILQQGLEEQGISYELVPGEGAFYGAKVEFALNDSLGREWQCGTFQLDFFLAKKFNCSFINEAGEREYPVILHRAVLGSLERFIAILLEHYKGRLPVYFNPFAIVLLPVAKDHIAHCLTIKAQLQKAGIACFIDDSDNSIGYRVRDSFKKKCIYSIVIGDDEIDSGMLNLRYKKARSNIHYLALDKFLLGH